MSGRRSHKRAGALPFTVGVGCGGAVPVADSLTAARFRSILDAEDSTARQCRREHVKDFALAVFPRGFDRT
jgi:hypothetical protein